MRYAEGLLEDSQNQSLFDWNSNAKVIVDELGRNFVDDVLLVKYKKRYLFFLAIQSPKIKPKNWNYFFFNSVHKFPLYKATL